MFAEEAESMTYILPLRDSKTPRQKNVDAANPKVNKALHIQLNLNLIHLNLNLNPKPKVNAVLHIPRSMRCCTFTCVLHAWSYTARTF